MKIFGVGYCYKGAVIKDKEGNEVSSEFVERLSKEYKMPKNVGETEKLARRQVREIEELVHKYGKVLEEVSKQILTKYPVAFPISLLPASKSKVQKALIESIEMLKYTNYTDEEKKKMAENLKGCLVFLDRFIDDEEAHKRNRELLENAEWQKLVKKRLNKNE